MVHAIVLLAHFHSLSSFVFSCGLTQELDTTESSQKNDHNKTQHKTDNLSRTPVSHNHGQPQMNGHSDETKKQGVTVDALMLRMKVLSEKNDEMSETELSNRFKNVELQAAELPSVPRDTTIEVPQQIYQYVDDPTFTYQDFARRGSENIPATFRIQDYSWDDHGYSLVNR